jgi:hypothetical protein
MLIPDVISYVKDLVIVANFGFALPIGSTDQEERLFITRLTYLNDGMGEP